MTANSEKTKLLLFLSPESCEDGCVATNVFEDQAKKMDVVWTSHSKLLGNSSIENGVCTQVSLEDLQKADLVILIEKLKSTSSAGGASNGSSLLKTKFSSWSGKLESWDISSGDVKETIGQYVGKLLVRLILQGGKRQPSAGQPVSSNPNLHTTRGATTNFDAKGPNTADSKRSVSKDAVRVSRESKGRGGKTVTIVSGLSLDDAKLQDLAKRLKQVCGTGGTVKEGKIEIQGDQCDRILVELQSRGYKAKRSGG